MTYMPHDLVWIRHRAGADGRSACLGQQSVAQRAAAGGSP